MKYFTSELWSGVNSLSKEESDKAHLEWTNNLKAYIEIFDSVKKRLPKKFLEVYNENKGFHDFDLVSISLNQTADSKKNPVFVHIDILDPYNDVRYRISYKYPTRFNVEYHKEIDRSGFDDWGYCEFLPVDKHTLSHEILFASGATILIHFKDKDISVEKLEEINKD